MLRRMFVAASLLATSFLIAGSAAADQTGSFSPPGDYYLALGDSLAFGFSHVKYARYADPTTGFIEPTVFDKGYVDDFGQALRLLRPGIQIVNLSCPGETSTSYFDGGCPYRPLPLHTDYVGAQRDAALAFLSAHPGQVSPITFNMGSNDVLPIQDLCPTFDPTCVAQHLPAALKTLDENLNQTLDEIRHVAPTTEIIVLEYYNPLAVESTATDAYTIELNDVIRAAALSHGARLADAFKPFNRTGNEVATLCVLTFMCIGPYTRYGKPDIHATDLGYAVIGERFWEASDYGWALSWLPDSSAGPLELQAARR